MSEAQSSPAAFSLPKPGPAHDRLKPFEGKFHAEVDVWMGPGEPMRSTGTMVNSWDLVGLYLHQHYQGNASAPGWPPFCGRGYWGFNFGTGEYEGFWIDNASSMIQTETGSVDAAGKVWNMVSEFIHPASGDKVRKRSEIRLIDRDHHEMETWMATGDEPEHRTMLIRYRRMGS
jgi:hypothetical protein